MTTFILSLWIESADTYRSRTGRTFASQSIFIGVPLLKCDALNRNVPTLRLELQPLEFRRIMLRNVIKCHTSKN